VERVNLDHNYVLPPPVPEIQEAVECNFDGIADGILIIFINYGI